MMIDVHIADGRTTFRFKSRGQFIDLVKRNLSELDETRAVACWARWHPQDEFVPVKITSVRAGSVAYTRVIEGEERRVFEHTFSLPQ